MYSLSISLVVLCISLFFKKLILIPFFFESLKIWWFLNEFVWWMMDVWNTVQCRGNCMEWNLFIGKNNLNKKQTSTRLSVIIFTILIRVISKSHAKNWDLQKFWLMFCLLRFFVATLGVKLCFLKWLLIRKATSFFARANLEHYCCVI